MGKKLRTQIKKDSTFNELSIVELDTVRNIRNLENMLARPEYTAVEAEYKRLRGARGGQIRWYSLFDGPKNIEELAAAVSDLGWYEVLYRIYSGEIHATNALESFHASKEMRGTYQPLRYPTDLPTVAQISVSMFLRTTRYLIDMLLPDEKLAHATWFKKEIQPDYDALTSFKIVDSDRLQRTPARRSPE